jgi:hypothetical protein
MNTQPTQSSHHLFRDLEFQAIYHFLNPDNNDKEVVVEKQNFSEKLENGK